jgi:hypothetical protein
MSPTVAQSSYFSGVHKEKIMKRLLRESCLQIRSNKNGLITSVEKIELMAIKRLEQVRDKRVIDMPPCYLIRTLSVLFSFIMSTQET